MKFILIAAALILGGCGSTYTCTESVSKITVYKDGSAVEVISCDKDPEAVKVKSKKFGTLKVKGYKCVRDENGTH